jgi:hypothetical protein
MKPLSNSAIHTLKIFGGYWPCVQPQFAYIELVTPGRKVIRLSAGDLEQHSADLLEIANWLRERKIDATKDK